MDTLWMGQWKGEVPKNYLEDVILSILTRPGWHQQEHKESVILLAMDWQSHEM